MASPVAPNPNKPFLIFFDFDETIVQESTDDAVVQVAPERQLPDWLTNSFRPGRFNEHMQRVMAYMAQQGVPEDAIRSAVERIPPSPGMLDLFQFLRAHPQDFEVVVVSDANMYFIEAWLQRVGARQLFRNIFTNPASFNSSGQLLLHPYHSHSCPRCPENMCKQVIVREYLSRRTKERGCPFHGVCFVGDGANDFCPSLALGSHDTVFPRQGYPLHKLIMETEKANFLGFKSSVVPWGTGHDVMAHLKNLVEDR